MYIQKGYVASKKETIKIFTNTDKSILKIETLSKDFEYTLLYEEEVELTKVNNSKLYTIKYTLPDYDCICIIHINEEIIFCSINFQNIFIYISDEDEIKYKSITPFGDIIEEDNLNKINNIHYIIPNIEYMIIEIDDNIYNIVPPKVSTSDIKGEYLIQPKRFQMIAIPRNDTIQYFLNLVKNKMADDSSFDGMDIRDVIQLIKAYPSNPDSYNKYQVYVPLVSADSAKFNLMQIDNDVVEIVPFFIKTGVFDKDILIKWNS